MLVIAHGHPDKPLDLKKLDVPLSFLDDLVNGETGKIDTDADREI